MAPQAHRRVRVGDAAEPGARDRSDVRDERRRSPRRAAAVAARRARQIHRGPLWTPPQGRAGRRRAGRVDRRDGNDRQEAGLRAQLADAALQPHGRLRAADAEQGVVPITAVPNVVRETILEWRNTRTGDMLFGHHGKALLALVGVIGLCVAVLIIRAMARRRAGRTQVALPAVLDWGQSSWLSIVRHGALLLLLCGLPFFVLALADPQSTLTQEQVSYPGRRIALMIDASSSMMARFPAAHLNAKAPNEATFFTTVAAAEAFVKQRMAGKYHDLIGLVEFGDEAYVVTPFTTDYDNILLSMSL